MKPSRGYLAWALLVVPLWLTCVWCTYWEPVMGDGWGHAGWYHEHALSLRELARMAKEIYLYENPRIGQLATLIAYAPGPLHPIVTPVLELGVLALITTLALGRGPSVRRPDDALAGLVVTAVVLACVPQIGPMLFYRPYTGNYVLGLALNLLWLVPYRLELVAARPPRRWLIPAMIVLGVAAGLSNEHTGVAMLAMALAATVACQRRGALRGWMIAGLIALAAGYALLLLAPGQHHRYSGLADEAGVLGRIAERGLAGDLAVLGRLAVALVPALPLVIAGALERGAPVADRRALLGLALGGVICTLTLLGSPKIGPRLYLASVALVAAGLVGWAMARLRRRWLRVAVTGASAAVVAVIGLRLILIFRTVGPLGAERFARIERGAPGSTVVVPRYPVPASRYFLGEDLASDKRLSVAEGYGLTIELAPAPGK